MNGDGREARTLAVRIASDNAESSFDLKRSVGARFLGISEKICTDQRLLFTPVVNIPAIVASRTALAQALRAQSLRIRRAPRCAN
jgi:hypothetical protein